MHIITEKIIISSEDGDSDYPSTLDVRIDCTQPNCPVSFYSSMTGKPIFSMAADEIPAFCAALRTMDLSWPPPP
jgi:hypothetical protein